MNAAQIAYLAAKAQHEATRDAAIAYMAPYDHLIYGTDEEAELYCQMSESAPNDAVTMKILVAAENALIEWALNKVDKVARLGEEKNSIEIVRRHMSNRKYRQQVLEAAMKLV